VNIGIYDKLIDRLGLGGEVPSAPPKKNQKIEFSRKVKKKMTISNEQCSTCTCKKKWENAIKERERGGIKKKATNNMAYLLYKSKKKKYKTDEMYPKKKTRREGWYIYFKFVWDWYKKAQRYEFGNEDL
jgi:hypothetical protein